MSRRPITPEEESERQRIGATLRVLREARGYTPDELANEVGISRPYLANIEAGRKPLTPILTAKLAKKLDVRQVAIVRDGYFPEEVAAAVNT